MSGRVVRTAELRHLNRAMAALTGMNVALMFVVIFTAMPWLAWLTIVAVQVANVVLHAWLWQVSSRRGEAS